MAQIDITECKQVQVEVRKSIKKLKRFADTIAPDLKYSSISICWLSKRLPVKDGTHLDPQASGYCEQLPKLRWSLVAADRNLLSRQCRPLRLAFNPETEVAYETTG